MTETAARPLADLDELNQWINDPANRAAWRDTLLGRQAAQVEQQRAEFEGTLASRRVSPEKQADARQALADAEALVELGQLAEQLAECTRLRLALLLAGFRRGATAEEDSDRESEAWAIRNSVMSIMRSLTEAQYLDPGEVARNAKAGLFDLLDRRRAVGAILTTAELQWWAAQTRRALRTIEFAPEAAAESS